MVGWGLRRWLGIWEMVHELQVKDLTLGKTSVVGREETNPWDQDYPSEGRWGNPSAVVKEGPLMRQQER